MEEKKIVLKGVRVHNLKNVDLKLDPNQFIVFTGVSGSGKSSLAFDTIYVEGQRRYIESLSTYARRQMGDMPKPDADLLSGISPTIAIEQKTAGKTPRSTVGTMTGIYDYLRVLYARVGIPHCPISGEEVAPRSSVSILHEIQQLEKGTKLIILAPFFKGKKGEFKEDFADLLRKGFTRVRLDGKVVEISDDLQIDKSVAHDVDLVIDRLTSDEPRLAEAITQALEWGKGVMSILNGDTETLYSTHAFAKKSKISYGPLEPHDFSFNHPSGMCPTCQGLGETQEFNLDLVIDPEKSIKEDCCKIASSYETVRYGNIFRNLVDVDKPWKKLSEKDKKVFLYGTEKKWTRMRFVHPKTGARWTEFVQWKGVLFEAKQRFCEAKSDFYRNNMKQLMTESVCPDCHGERIKPYPSAATIAGKRISEVCKMPVKECTALFEKLQLGVVAEELLKEIRERLKFLMGVGLHYLALERTAPTLSGGESQRVRLASQIGSGLVGATYILDEPSIGLHPRDNQKLLQTLINLKEKGNTVIVVEHDEETIEAADYVVDVGPLAGRKGGKIVAQGTVKDLLSSKESITAKYLTGEVKLPSSKKRKSSSSITLKKASHHNLKNLTVSFPLEVFTAVTGVSGSGKSSLISDTLYPALSGTKGGKFGSIEGKEKIDKVICIDQSPIGRTPRSNPATYIKLFDEIRDLFSNLPESKAQGYLPGRFSFNVKEGSCFTCGGMGMTKIDMDFLEDEWVTCSECNGKRFDQNTLSVSYKNKNIADILEMTVQEALDFFSAVPQIKTKLQLLIDVGLDYLALGQPSPTLSGGEAQRIKLAKELSRPDTGKTFYILDEPTTGLHFHDIGKLIGVLQSLVDKGNTVLVIEHNMDLVRAADWVIELGPEGGEEGGKLVAEGTVEKIRKGKTATGEALREKKKTGNGHSIGIGNTNVHEIVVEGAEQNNLKNVSARIPRGKITLCTGPSGSGKSSFAFETIYAEGQRRYIESLSPYQRQFVKQMPKPKVESIEGLSAAIAIEQKHHAGNPRSTLGTITEIYDFLRVLFSVLGTSEETKIVSKEEVLRRLLTLPKNTKIQVLSPVKTIEGLQKKGFLRVRLNGKYYELEEEIPIEKGRKQALFVVIDRIAIQENAEKRLLEAISLAGEKFTVALEDRDLEFNLSSSRVTPHTFSFNTEEGMCPDCQGLGVQYGASVEKQKEFMKETPLGLMYLLWQENATREAVKHFCQVVKHPKTPLKDLSQKDLLIFLYGNEDWLGLNNVFAKLSKAGPSYFKEILSPLLEESPCLSCRGTRLKPLARNIQIGDLSIADVCALSIDDALKFVSSLQETDLTKEITTRLSFLQKLGLGYLSLNRSARSLSGGETQRTYLSRQLGSGLTGCLYILDEPTIGLHPHNNALLNEALKKLVSLGNTLILVEHDPMTMGIADYFLDFGPKAGREGGKIVAEGTFEEIQKNPASVTGQYLSGKKTIPIPEKRRSPSGYLKVKDAHNHNLKHLNVDFPLSCMTCITGVSGSGKSSLLDEIKKQKVEKLIVLEQSPIGQTNRADVSTYIDLLTPLRYFFASLPTAKAKGLAPKNFSFNHKKGMCMKCWGLGVRNIHLQFLPPVKVECDACRGFRLNPLSLEVHLNGKHLGHILNMTVKEAKEWLPFLPKVMRILDILTSVGLDYLKLGQEVQTLSGGEAQRLRLCKELGKRQTGNTLYLFDEPTTGLHYVDIEKLLLIFHTLVDKGNTVILIEHNLDLILHADHIIDLGPGAGDKGGEIVAIGTPEEIMKHKQSYTGKYLREYISK